MDKKDELKYAWFVGVQDGNSEGKTYDYCDDFVNKGIWINGWHDKHLDLVKEIKPGDRIAIKAVYKRKNNLPFDSSGKEAGVMAIKAIGTVESNAGDGRNIYVKWEKVDPLREWYGQGQCRATIHKVVAADSIIKAGLLRFTFNNEPQDYSICEKYYKNKIADTEDIDNPPDTSISANDTANSLSINELGAKLKEMYDNATDNAKVVAVHMFGLKYGQQIREGKYTAKAIVEAANIKASYDNEVNQGLNIYDSICRNEYGVYFTNAALSEIAAPESIDVEMMGIPKRSTRVDKRYPLNVILYGAPGTGKTYSTIEYALKRLGVWAANGDDSDHKENLEKYKSLVQEGRIVFTTFHQNYGYEDFIQGLRPDKNKVGLAFKDVDGVFKKIADKAIRDQKNNYVIIIDEINRANISKVFGELITLIEDDKRWGEENETSVTLSSGERFAVPNNLYIIGTMNSTDKSISLIDAALRRRFEFNEVSPNPDLIKVAKLKNIFTELNKKLEEDLKSTDLLIGHSYFMNKDEADLVNIMNTNIIPLLYEYYYDDKEKIKSLLSNILQANGLQVDHENNLCRLRVKMKADELI